MSDDLQNTWYLGSYARSSLGLRLGGSYHVALPHATLIGRLGFFFDGALPRPDQVIASGFGQTAVMVDNERLYLFSGTAGVGVQTSHLEVNVGYGYVSQLIQGSPPLTQQDGLSASHLMSLSLLLRL
jgi:hypothetical protein